MEDKLKLLEKYEFEIDQLYHKLWGMIIEMDARLTEDVLKRSDYHYYFNLALRRIENSRRHWEKMIEILREEITGKQVVQ